jgi:hypothetical protein
VGFLIPLLFVQRGIIYNNIQFMQYFLLIFGFYAAVSIYKILRFWRNLIIKTIIIIVLVLLSCPTVIGNLVEFYGRPPLAMVSNAQLQALKYLQQYSDKEAVVLAVSFNKYLNTKYQTQPWPIYAWYSTSYIPALASRRTYLSAEEQALITDYPVESRQKKIIDFFAQNDFEQNRKFLKEAGISYIYINKDELEKPLKRAENNLDVFFENSEVVIYQVNKD